MRPVVRGESPKDKKGCDIRFSSYQDARGELIRRMGEYCSYCEMHLDAALAVEHVQPKQPPGAAEVDETRALNWNNFLLACMSCNSTKSNKDLNLSDYLWPDKDNTFRALSYSEGGIVSIAHGTGVEKETKNLIGLVGLDKTPNDQKASDRRWMNRREAWDQAVRAKSRLLNTDIADLREQITETAAAKGFWSIWMTIFSDDPDMLRRLIAAFPGTCEACFDHNQRYSQVPRPDGQC